ncbi:fascin domain-containing protein [Actinoplanes philippinensis]|uniref:fascin domain-containing protein n=1 Tax=Actinoplanes philippinensis TaxID=35752 RepID=UPI0034028354
MKSAVRRLAAVPVGILLLASLAEPAGASGSTAILTPPGAGSPVLERMRHDVAAATGAADVPCWHDLTIKSIANGRYVSAEIGWDGGDYGALRARAATPGKWEKFIVCRDAATGVTRIRAQANNDFVSAELDYDGARYGMLRAQADKVGGWERYYSNSAPGGQFSFYTRDTKRWVAAETTFTGRLYGVLRARATSVSAQETFAW